MDHVNLEFEDCTTHTINFCCDIEHIYMYACVLYNESFYIRLAVFR